MTACMPMGARRSSSYSRRTRVKTGMIAVATASATCCGADWHSVAMCPKQSIAEICSQKLVPVLCEGTRANGRAMAVDGLQRSISESRHTIGSQYEDASVLRPSGDHRRNSVQIAIKMPHGRTFGVLHTVQEPCSAADIAEMQLALAKNSRWLLVHWHACRDNPSPMVSQAPEAFPALDPHVQAGPCLLKPALPQWSAAHATYYAHHHRPQHIPWTSLPKHCARRHNMWP